MKGTGSLSASTGWISFAVRTWLHSLPHSKSQRLPIFCRGCLQSAQSESSEATRRNGKNLAAITSMGSVFTEDLSNLSFCLCRWRGTE